MFIRVQSKPVVKSARINVYVAEATRQQLEVLALVTQQQKNTVVAKALDRLYQELRQTECPDLPDLAPSLF